MSGISRIFLAKKQTCRIATAYEAPASRAIKGKLYTSKNVCQWRDLTRYRRSKIEDLGNKKRQVHKLFESANIKIDSVAVHLFSR